MMDFLVGRCDGIFRKRINDLDLSHDMVVHRFQIFRRYPPLGVLVPADLLHRIFRHETGEHPKLGDETGAARFDVPIARNLDRILFVSDRIEDRLIRQAWWLSPIAGGANQRQLCGPGWTIEKNSVVAHGQNLPRGIAYFATPVSVGEIQPEFSGAEGPGGMWQPVVICRRNSSPACPGDPANATD